MDKQMKDQAKWSVVFSVIHISLILLSTYVLWKKTGLHISIPTFDFIILILATFRLTRLFVYDHIMEWFRNFPMDRTLYDDGSVEYIKPVMGFRAALATLLQCPWCMAVWMGLPVTFLYFYTPFAWYPLFVFATIGAATFLQISVNMIGWTAEVQKQKVLGDKRD
jgi:Protein of unknown function (DUF1360)